MSVLSRLRQWRHLVVLLGLVWLPLSVYAQVCTTHAAVAAIGGAAHPGMPQPGDREFTAAALDSAMVVVDAGTFWRTVGEPDSACDMKAFCAFASLAILISDHSTAVPFAAGSETLPAVCSSFHSRDTAPEIPPPRSNA